MMTTRRTLSALVAASGLVAGGFAGLALPSVAGAEPAGGERVVTFDVESGSLSISVPTDGDATDLGDGDPGDPISSQLGTVTVTDERAALDGSWTASVVSTDFTTGGGTASETIAASDVDYWSGPAVATTGTGTFIPGQATSDDAAPLDDAEPVTAFTHTGGTGNNMAQWNPTIVVNVPSPNVAGTYTGTITHSVA